jgi:DNA-binding transcriptional regulator YiaG
METTTAAQMRRESTMETTTVGKNIKARREAQGTKKHYLAVTLGVYDSTIYGWESGRSVPSVAWLLRIALALDCMASDLLEGVV